ncbi:methyl-accepting chemotaxis protein [Curvibacter sp. CHRR-16]|uniref:methyl-accepting chemotaxis protein n=1 Tax=Curvibacter sp. CHRR-16 TaxID=2835872 RepID=UPI002023A2E1|nr:methyl-accepting chemotaxis protein [Curvibacter sp. CHRR-16]
MSVLIVFAAVLVLGAISYSIAKGYILADLNNELVTVSKAQGDLLGRWAQMQKQIVQGIAGNYQQADLAPVLQQSTVSGQQDLAYIGFADKRMVSIPPRDRPAEYDPTARPWYKLADQVGGAVITPPYMAASSKKLVVTFAYPIKNGGTTQAVAGADVTVEDVIKGITQIHPTPSGFAFLLDKDSRILAHPDAALTLKPVGELSASITPEVLALAKQSDQEPALAEVGGKTFFLKAVAVPQTDWVLVTAAERGEALARLNNLLISIVVTLLVVSVVAGMLATGAIHALLQGLTHVRNAMLQIGSSNGDLTQRLPIKGEDEIAELSNAFNQFVAKIEAVMLDVRESASSIAVASSEIALGSQDLSNRTERTASNIAEVSSSMDHLNQLVKHSADNAHNGQGLSQSSAQSADKGGQVVEQVISTMANITDSSRRIADITAVIDGIAFQTNILALNAAVEAARAGEQGRGFAVVASEVRALASRSAEAAKEIKQLIGTSVERVEDGSRLVGEAGLSMNEIVQSVRQVTYIVQEISEGSRKQSSGIDEIYTAISDLDQMTQQNAALVEESAAAAASLKDQAAHLAQVVGSFKLGEHR